MISVSATLHSRRGADCSAAIPKVAATGAAVSPSRPFSFDLARWRADARPGRNPGVVVSLAGLFRPASATCRPEG